MLDRALMIKKADKKLSIAAKIEDLIQEMKLYEYGTANSDIYEKLQERLMGLQCDLMGI